MGLNRLSGAGRGGLRNLSEIGAIPYEDELSANYDARKLSLNNGDLVSTWPDETSNANDLTAGTSPEYNSSAINGNAAVEFDGSTTYLNHSEWSISQPNTLFAVLKWKSTGNGTDTFAWSGTSTRQAFVEKNGSYRMLGGGGNYNNMGGSDTNWHVFTTHWDGSNSHFRFDQTEYYPGNEPNGLNGYRLGGGDDGAYAFITVGQVLVYANDQSNNESEIEQHLADEWGLTL